jgi:deoxyribonuclease-4
MTDNKEKKKLYVGSHVFTSHGFVSSADYAVKIKANVFQIFLGSPQNYNSKRHSKEELEQLRDNIKEYKIKVVVHANYMLNFCNPVDDYKHTAAVKLLVNDLTDSSVLDAEGVVIHMGKKLKLSKEEAVKNYVTGIKEALKLSPKESTIIFETGAGVGTEICTSIIDLGDLYNKFTTDEKKRIKFCIDTCHVFAAGYDLGCEGYVDVFCDLIKLHLGWSNIACVHLNDSKCKLNSKKDRHEDITQGLIKEEGLKKFVRKCYTKGVPMILETPCENLSRREQLELIKKWCQVTE